VTKVIARPFARHHDAAIAPGHELARGATAGGLAAREVAREQVRLVVIPRDAEVAPHITGFGELPRLLAPGDLVVVNDAATLPASLRGTTGRGELFELRLSAPVAWPGLAGIVFGAGDHRTRTEQRAPAPPLAVGDRVRIAALPATVTARDGMRIELRAEATDADAAMQALYTAGRPVQYAHRQEPLAMWAVQTAYAARPWASEMPSAGRPLTWDVLLALRRAGIGLARLTHAAGLSSTGDAALDRTLPWPERYDLPTETVAAIAATHARGGRVVAIGTSVVRTLEDAALRGELRTGEAVATLRIDGDHAPRVVGAVVSGLHAPGESHFELLSAFAPRAQLARALELAGRHGMSAHELGDACLIV
jgi:S-adenosylmethionine:tRNA ribosyltransferase-isomerase